MRKITLTAGTEKLTGHLPGEGNWDEVPLTHYAALVAARPPEGTDTPALCHAVAQLTGLPVGPLLDDVSLLAVILEAAPWLFGGQLPPAGEPVPEFTHEGIRYDFVGGLQKINAGQMEALYAFLKANEGGPLTCAPQLLAVLYCPHGMAQTPEVVRDASTAFAALPMSVAWPALADFIGSSGPRATSILAASALSAQVSNLLATIEQATTGASTTFFSKPLSFLTRMWIRYARKQL